MTECLLGSNKWPWKSFEETVGWGSFCILSVKSLKTKLPPSCETRILSHKMRYLYRDKTLILRDEKL